MARDASDKHGGTIGWYVHLPFCSTKCGYCDFYSLPTQPQLAEPLAAALKREMSLRDPERPVESVFVGGGTPTVLPAEALATILTAVRERTAGAEEFSVEANPSSADELKLALLRNQGVNRLSLGAQSFNADDLAVLERLHSPEHIPSSVRLAREAGFDNINLDLIYGIPGQSRERWRETLNRAIDLGPEHLACYSLMYEPGTSLTRLRREGRLIPCDEDAEADMFEETIDVLTAAGYEHYEISNFARPGRQCRANIAYWENREYLGVGPSAVSYLDGTRRRNVPDVRKYVLAMQHDPAAAVQEEETLGELEHCCETAVQMLRLTRGIEQSRFVSQTGRDPLMLFAEPIARMQGEGLLRADDECIRLTRKGMLLANYVMREFLLYDVVSDGGESASV